MELSCLQQNRLYGRDRVVEELVQGRRIANQLKTHLDKPIENDGSVSKEDLSVMILESFTKALSLISNNNGGDLYGVSHPTVMNHHRVILQSNQSESPKCNFQRKCSRKRKITSEGDTEEREEPFESMDDGYMWRKYGQKDIKNHKHPRSYYRCTYSEQGCEARKYVQQISDYPPMYKTTCTGRHTCGNSVKDYGFVVDFGLPSNMIRFDKFEEKENRDDVGDECPEEGYTVDDLWPSDNFPMVDSFDLDSLDFDFGIDQSLFCDWLGRAEQKIVSHC